ncbi:MAG: hypothetical protein LUE86_00495 [Clostridiales bacterium]|nr:hypothetical protein [Clostridiales bacterium]
MIIGDHGAGKSQWLKDELIEEENRNYRTVILDWYREYKDMMLNMGGTVITAEYTDISSDREERMSKRNRDLIPYFAVCEDMCIEFDVQDGTKDLISYDLSHLSRYRQVTAIRILELIMKTALIKQQKTLIYLEDLSHLIGTSGTESCGDYCFVPDLWDEASQHYCMLCGLVQDVSEVYLPRCLRTLFLDSEFVIHTKHHDMARSILDSGWDCLLTDRQKTDILKRCPDAETEATMYDSKQDLVYICNEKN